MKKKRTFKIALLTGTAVSLFFVPWLLVRAWLAPLPDTVQEQVNDAVGLGIDGIIVYADRPGGPPAIYTAGYNDRDKQTPARADALFKIASISKLYIAVAAAKLASSGRLPLDQTLAGYLPDLQGRIENAEKITLKMMLQHRSGIPNFSDDPDFPWPNPPRTDRETLAYALDKPADFAPDADYAYSNTNYLLIGEIMDKTLGYSHHRYIHDELLVPLGLHHTFSLLSEVDIDYVMSGYFVGYGPDIKYNDFISPGGSMVATIEDVGIFLRALNDGSLLSEAEQAVYASVYVYEHTGLLPGYQSIAKYHPDLDRVVVLFMNTSGGKMWNLAEIVYNRIVKILRKGENPQPST